MHSCLYLLLQNLISSNNQIRCASDAALRVVSAATGHSTVRHLVVANADYIIDSLCQFRFQSFHCCSHAWGRLGTPCSGSLIASTTLIVCLSRGTRFVFQWSGVKRIEAVSGQTWDTVPKSCLVLIGIDSSELEDIFVCLSRPTDPPEIFFDGGLAKEYARQFFQLISKDGRFKEPSLEKEPLVIFGVKGSPLRGIKENTICSCCLMGFLTLRKHGMKFDWPSVRPYPSFVTFPPADFGEFMVKDREG